MKMMKWDSERCESSMGNIKSIYIIKTYEIKEMILEYERKILEIAKEKGIDIFHLIKSQ